MTSGRYCPITLEALSSAGRYSTHGLRRLHPRVRQLEPLELTTEQLIADAAVRSDKMSIQGVQPKLSAILRVQAGRLEIVDVGGRYILKPNPPHFKEVPANESLTMTLAEKAGIDVAPHGLVEAVDGSWVYWIRRFDRVGRKGKLPVEDFAQLGGHTRDTKYGSSMEQVAATLDRFATFPVVEKPKLALRTLFSFLFGNEDMHLKNFSLITTDDVVSLSPAYDLLNTTIVLERAHEEIALPLNGKKSRLTRKDLVEYYCVERLGLTAGTVSNMLEALSGIVRDAEERVGRSFLSSEPADAYLAVVADRADRLRLR